MTADFKAALEELFNKILNFVLGILKVEFPEFGGILGDEEVAE